jgi:hypothetical protein
MIKTIGNNVRPVDSCEFARWFGRAHEPWNPITAAERQLAALIGDAGHLAALAAYDNLYDVPNQAMRWLELNSSRTEMGDDLPSRQDATRWSINERTFDS